MKIAHNLLTSFCIVFLLLQACVSNKTSSESTSSIASVIVQTNDGYTYDLPWYEVKEGNLVSILNTSRIVLDQDQVIEITINNPDRRTVDINVALKFDGEVCVLAFNEGHRTHHYRFYEVKEVRGQIVGFTYTAGDTADISIPLNNVKKIDVEKVQYTKHAEVNAFDWAELIFNIASAFATYY